MHKTSGRWQYGLALALTTATLWGMLPIALKGLLTSIDSITITWYRFAVAVVFVGFMLVRRNRIPDFRWLKQAKGLLLFGLVIVGLSSNYILYLMGLDRVSPSAAQIVIQIAPLLLLIGGIFVFKESFSWIQWLGVVLFVSGLLLFFNHRMEALWSGHSDYQWGVILVLIAAIAWAAYALAQKQLLLNYGSQQIMFISYIAASLIFFPSAEVLSVSVLSPLQWGLLIFCCANTLIAYGCFAEALEHWEASRVSAVLAITPLMTILFAHLVAYLWPAYIQLEALNALSIIGAFVVVIGSLITAMAKVKVKE